MFAQTLWLLVVGAALVNQAPPEDQAKPGLEQLQGTWAAVGVQQDGKDLQETDFQGYQLVIVGNRYTTRTGERVIEQGVIRVEPEKSPAGLVLIKNTGTGKGQPKHGIYELAGTQLKICGTSIPNKEAPADFTTRPNSGRILIVLTREEPRDQP